MEIVFRIVVFGLISLFFTFGMQFRKKDWYYGGEKHDAKETRETGWKIFWGIFIGLNVLWGIGNNN
jgi:hypothetical protein